MTSQAAKVPSGVSPGGITRDITANTPNTRGVGPAVSQSSANAPNRLITIAKIALVILAVTALIFLEIKYHVFTIALVITLSNPILAGFALAILAGAALYFVIRNLRHPPKTGQNQEPIALRDPLPDHHPIEQKSNVAQQAFAAATKKSKDAEAAYYQYMLGSNTDPSGESALLAAKTKAQEELTAATDYLKLAQKEHYDNHLDTSFTAANFA